jgi:hypothetical protein
MNNEKRYNIASTSALMLLSLLFIFPQIQLQIRYLIPLVGLLLVLEPRVLNEKLLKISVLVELYITIVGIIIVWLYNDGSIENALSPLKDLLWITVAFIAVRNVSLKSYYWSTFIVLIISFIGLLLDTYAGPAQRWIPFSIQNETHLDYAGGYEAHDKVERYGGFTYEAGVLAGMSAIFIMMLPMLISGIFNSNKIRFSSLDRCVTIFAFISGLGIMLLTKTKSGISIIITSTFLYLLSSLLFIKSDISSYKRRINLLLIVLSIPIICYFTTVLSHGNRNYFQEEYDNILGAINGEHRADLGEGGGLTSRIQGLLLATYSFVQHPLGSGLTLCENYTNGSREKIEATPEMLNFWREGKYCTYYSYFAAFATHGGIFSLLFLLYLWHYLYRQYHKSKFVFLRMYGIIFMIAFIVLSINVELLPYIPMVVYVSSFPKIYDMYNSKLH